jgi:hypothetical protein
VRRRGRTGRGICGICGIRRYPRGVGGVGGIRGVGGIGGIRGFRGARRWGICHGGCTASFLPESRLGVILCPFHAASIRRAELPDARVIVAAEDDFARVLRGAAKEAHILGVAGGDGSVNMAAALAVEEGLPLLLIPAGYALRLPTARRCIWPWTAR